MQLKSLVTGEKTNKKTLKNRSHKSFTSPVISILSMHEVTADSGQGVDLQQDQSRGGWPSASTSWGYGEDRMDTKILIKY